MKRLAMYWPLLLLMNPTCGASLTEAEVARLLEQNLALEAFAQLNADRPSATAEELRLLASLYERGLGTAKDPKAAKELYIEASKRGDSQSKLWLAKNQGSATPEAAVEAWRAAADAGAKEALLPAAQAVANAEPALARQYLEKAVAAGVPGAPLALAKFILFTPVASSANLASAKSLLAPLATEGNPEALLLLAEIALADKSSPMRYRQAASYYEQAAARGSPEALAKLAQLEEQGLAGERDPTRILERYRRAAAGGIGWARTEIERLERLASSIRLFGVTLEGATQSQVRQALVKFPAPPLGVGAFYDAYDATQLLESASTLVLTYTARPKSNLAEVVYTFDAPTATNARARILAMLEKKYGPPQRRRVEVVTPTGKRMEDIPLWRINDTQIHLQRDPASSKQLLIYRMAPYYEELQKQLALAGQAAEANGVIPPDSY